MKWKRNEETWTEVLTRLVWTILVGCWRSWIHSWLKWCTLWSCWRLWERVLRKVPEENFTLSTELFKQISCHRVIRTLSIRIKLWKTMPWTEKHNKTILTNHQRGRIPANQSTGGGEGVCIFLAIQISFSKVYDCFKTSFKNLLLTKTYGLQLCLFHKNS